MIDTSLGSMALAHREEYTSAALKRSANIQYCAPQGYFKLIHAITLAAFDGDPQTIGTIRGKYDDSYGGSKDIMTNIGKLTAQPFPIVVSSKKLSKDSLVTKDAPLYDIVTGNTVDEGYASVALSPLGRLMTRHYKDEPMDFSDHYRSIVPFSLLRKSMPWTMGHKSEHYPLNPNELFRIMIKMIEKGNPIIDDKDLEDIFRGFDLGEGYTIYMTSAALISLYTKGESSFMVMPDIEVRRSENKIVIKIAPINTTSKNTASYLSDKAMDQSEKSFKTVEVNPEIKMVGKEIHIDVTRWRGTDKQVLDEFYHDRFITRKLYTRNESVRYKEGYQMDKGIEEDKTLGKAKLPVSLFDIDELKDNFTEEQIMQFGAKDIMDNLNDLEVIVGDGKSREREKKHFRAMIKGDGTAKQLLDSGNFEISKNPYPFELDVVPVYEVLWDCIQYEKECQLKALKKELASLQSKLKMDLLLEKITRPEVAKVIHKLEPESNRNRLLLEQCRKGSEILPEGLANWEVELVYAYHGNNFLPKIFFRDKFKDQYQITIKLIEELESLINSPKAIMNKIKEDLQLFVRDTKYDRKSKVYFLKEEINLKIDYISANDTWDNYDLPCTIYFDGKYIRRSYGVNMYFNDFEPVMEINTTNESKIQILYRTNKGTLKWKIYQAKEIPRGRSVALPPNLVGILPVEPNHETQVMFWTNLSRYHIYNRLLTGDINLEPQEKILGWCYIGLDNKYLDIRCSTGITRVFFSEFPQFKTTMKSFPAHMGLVYDILPRNTNDNIMRLWLNSYKDYQRFETTLLKSKNAKPRPIDEDKFSKVFSVNMNRYYESVFIWNWNAIGFSSEHKYQSPKKVILEEYAFFDDKDRLSKTILKSVRNITRANINRTNIIPHTDITTIARYTKSYLNFNPLEFADKDVIDRRVLRKLGAI